MSGGPTTFCPKCDRLLSKFEELHGNRFAQLVLLQKYDRHRDNDHGRGGGKPGGAYK